MSSLVGSFHLGLRFFKAYRVLTGILLSYGILGLKKRILSSARLRDQIEKKHRETSQKIFQTILELKGLFIKVGQMLSIMSNFLPDDLRKGLEGLQDRVPPHPYEAIEKRFLQEFGKKPAELFRRFEERPIASASLGQVHRGELADGTPVAVKVQYPEIEEIVRADLKILSRIFGLLHFLFPSYGLRPVYEEIAQVVQGELDYLEEGKNLETLKKNFSKENVFLFPDVFWDCSTRRILTLRYMEGTKVSATEELLKDGIDLRQIATRIIHAYCKQIFLDGVYHADPHPGNLLIQKGGQIVLIDFGATAKISERMRKGMARFVEGLIKKDTRLLSGSMREMGFVAHEEGGEPFERLIDYFYERLSDLKIENFKNLNLGQRESLEELLELKKLKISFRDLMNSFHVPRDWLLLERTLLLIFGLTTHLDPKLNPMEIVLPYVEKFVLQDRPLVDVVMAITKEIGISYLQLPHEIQKTLRRLNEGQLSLKNRDLGRQIQRLYLLGHQFLYALLGLGGLFLGIRLGEVGFLAEARYSYWGSGILGALLVISLIKNRKISP